MKRYGQIIGVKSDELEKYKELHAKVWPGVLEIITLCNIRNYSIFYKNGLLFAYYEYIGDDFVADMEKMAADPITKQWWDKCMPCQIPVEGAKEDEWWANMEEVFHWD